MLTFLQPFSIRVSHSTVDQHLAWWNITLVAKLSISPVSGYLSGFPVEKTCAPEARNVSAGIVNDVYAR